MKSLKYVLSHCPCNRDDCIDMMHMTKPKRVSLRLRICEFITEFHILEQLRGEYIWEFNNQEVQYEEIYGGFFLNDSDRRQSLNIEKANQKLVQRICRLISQGVDITYRNIRFDNLFSIKGYNDAIHAFFAEGCECFHHCICGGIH